LKTEIYQALFDVLGDGSSTARVCERSKTVLSISHHRAMTYHKDTHHRQRPWNIHH
jgi:hypothetical protein